MARPGAVDGRAWTSISQTCCWRSYHRRASDLHLSAGAHPTVRVRGRLTPLEDYPKLSPDRHARDHLLDPHRRPAPAPGDRLAARLRLLDPRPRPLPRQRLLPARRDRRRLPPDPLRADLDRRARPAAVVHEFTRKPRGFVLVTGPTGSGKSTSLAAMIDEINRTREEHIMTIEDPIEFLHAHKQLPGQPARARLRRAELRRRAEGRAAPGPRRDPRRRDARPRDDLHRADRGRDRPPRVRHAAHPGRRADDRPRDRRVPAPPAGPGARAAVGRAAGHHDPAAAADRRRLRPRRGAARCSCPTRRCAT